MIAARRSCLEAGDYNPKLAEDIGQLEAMAESIDARLRDELVQLIADLKKLLD
jgi:hypothetical protein